MPSREHTSKHYEELLTTLKDRLLIMSNKAEQLIADSMRAVVETRLSLARDVIKRDDEVDRLEMEIDELCLQILALEQPVASDLRFVATALKIVKDLERIGDTGVNIAERALELIEQPWLQPPVDLPVMAEAAQRILKNSLDAFVNSDAELAERVIRDDQTIDTLYERIFTELLAFMIRDPGTISRVLKLIFIAKYLERVGDHSANIAEMVVFLVKGQDIRHGTRVDRR